MIPVVPTRKRRSRNILLSVAVFSLLMLVAGYAAISISPKPSAWVIRMAFNRGGEKLNAQLEKHVPTGVGELTGIDYEGSESGNQLDLYYPASSHHAGKLLPLIVFIHGGGWVAGSREHVSNYCRILASLGYTVANIDYSLAPDATYPIPVRQSHAALAYLVEHADSLNIDPSRIFLAGDSGGAHIASQVATTSVNSAYADKLGVTPAISGKQLRGMLLFCGPYSMDNPMPGGRRGWFVNTVLWAYSGDKNYSENKFFATASVLDYVDSSFPPTFITVGNADMLEPQSKTFARKLAASGVSVDSLFYDSNYKPELGHEYQFNLDRPEGKVSLQRVEEFLEEHSLISI